jgi:outer membrane receptor protein involved in Fe transport
LSSLVKYVGSKDRAINDTRSALDGYTTLDFSLSYKNTHYGYKLLLSAKNITNVDVRYPSKPKSYEDDYAQERRNFFISLTKEF